MFAQLINRINRTGASDGDGVDSASAAADALFGGVDGNADHRAGQRALVHLAIDWVDAPLAFFDRGLALQFVNSAFGRLVGQARDALVGTPIDDALPAAGLDSDSVRRYAERALDGESVDVDLAHRSDGALDGLARVQFRPQTTSDGRIIGALCVMHRLGRRETDRRADGGDPVDGLSRDPEPVSAPMRAALRLAQDDVVERERKQRELIGGLPLPLVFIGSDGVCRWGNVAFARLFGIAERDIAGRPAARLRGMPRDAVREGLERATAREAHRVEERLSPADGEARRYRLDFLPGFDRDQAPNGAYLLLTETDEANASADEAHLRGYAEHVAETIVLVDRDLRFRYANASFLRRSRKTREDLLGRTIEEAFGPAMLERSRDALQRALHGETFSRSITSFFDDTDASYEARYLPSRDASGEIDGVYVTSRSLAEEQRAERAVRERDERIRFLTDALPAQISYVTADLRYQYCNRRFLHDYGLSSVDEVIGKRAEEILGADVGEQVDAYRVAALRGERVEYERRIAGPEGEDRWLAVSMAADFAEDGAPRGLFAIAWDVTDSKRAERQQSHQQALIEAFTENFPQPLCYLDRDGKHRHTNRAYEAFAARPKVDIIGRTGSEVFGGEIAGKFRPAFLRARDGERLNTEHDVALGGDAIRHFTADWLPDLDDDGRVRGVYLTLQDVGEAQAARRAYEESLREMQRAMDSVALPISFVDLDGRLRFVNHTTTVWYGRAADELIGMPLSDLMSGDDYRFAKPYIDAALSGESVQYEREMRYHDGARRWVLIRYVATRDEEGAVTGFYTTATDIQSRKKHEIALQQANGLLTAHFENTPLASFTLDGNGRVTRWSSQAEMLFGWRRDEAIERTFDELALVDRDVLQEFLPTDRDPNNTLGNTRLHIVSAQRSDGSRVTCEWHIAALRDPGGRITSTLALVQDVSQRVEAERRLTEIAHRDTLTRLLNRNALEPTLRAFIERARQGASGVAVLFLDLDHFKNINDTLGHRVGDLMLIEVAAILRHSVRSEDEVARIGGDEFMVVIGHQSPKAIAHETAQRILAALSTPIRVDNQRLSVTSSIGIAIYPDHGRAPEALIRSADLAMYRAKEQGKNRFEFFSAALAQQSERRSAVKTALKLALQKDALRLYFQPRVRIGDNRIVGAEALLRWTDPRLGVVSPKEFIVIAEESGLIHELGLYVFQKACRQLRDWQDRGIELGTLSVNFSAHQLLVATFTDEVDDVIRASGVDPRSIEVEITETSMLFDLGVTKSVIADLKARGMRIAIDDFGTGFSSLSHLQQLDVDTLKIDQSFIRDMLHDAGDAAITTSVISLARGLGLSTTAEGVEQDLQLEVLREAGCDCYQGFLFSPAIVVEDLENLLGAQATADRG